MWCSSYTIQWEVPLRVVCSFYWHCSHNQSNIQVKELRNKIKAVKNSLKHEVRETVDWHIQNLQLHWYVHTYLLRQSIACDDDWLVINSCMSMSPVTGQIIPGSLWNNQVLEVPFYGANRCSCSWENRTCFLFLRHATHGTLHQLCMERRKVSSYKNFLIW